MLALKKILQQINKKQLELADHCGFSKATIGQLINHNQWPKCISENDLRERILSFLITHGVNTTKQNPFLKVEPEGGTPLTPDHLSNQSQEDTDMLKRKQLLSQQAQKQFGIVRDPFGDLRSDADLWVSQDIRIVREHMFDTAKHGGILAVIGESGAGKTSVRRSLKQRIFNEHQSIIIAQPYMMAAEDSEKKGKLIKINHITDSILRKVAPQEKFRISSEARFDQLERALRNVTNSGQSVCVVIEEAHSLSIPCLKHLKRLYELDTDSGYGSLISIILIGQPELLQKLDEKNPEIRELVQRCQIVNLPPIAVADLESFIDFRLARIGKKAADIIDQSGIAALATRLVNRAGQSQLYPLFVGNFLSAAMNDAAAIGIPVIDADVIKGVA